MPDHSILASNISGINRLTAAEKRAAYSLLIPPELVSRFKLNPFYFDQNGIDLLTLHCKPGNSSAEMKLFHQAGFPDPILYGQVADTINGQVHVLLYVLNDPDSPRFDVDRMPDGSETKFGTLKRNLPAEISALEYGLAPGQIRRGLRLLGSAIQAFERFVAALGQDLFFTEPLYYHNAIIFERYGFAYQKGKKLMERIHTGFSEEGDLKSLLDGSTPFRQMDASERIRLRSWAIHDNILGEPFTGVTMYKYVGKSAGLNTSRWLNW
jgi:hypothetical protein